MRSTGHAQGLRARMLQTAAITVFAVAVVTAGTAGLGLTGPAPVSYYVAVGDSLAAGYAAPPGAGYADDLLATWRAQVPALTLQNFGCANETTATMLHGGYCTYPQGPQLAAAEAFLAAHRGQVAVITIDIGGNDVVGCGEGGLDVACLQQGLATVGANLRTIVAGLRAAAGPGVPIIGMNYFDPFLTRWLEGPPGQAFAQATVPLNDQVSGLLAQAYGAFGVPVADVETAFATHDFTTTVTRPYGTVPINVAHICDWLDATCHPGGADFLGVDANATGYQMIAGAFAAVTPPLVPAVTVATDDMIVVPTSASPPNDGAGAPDGEASGAPLLPRTGGGGGDPGVGCARRDRDRLRAHPCGLRTPARPPRNQRRPRGPQVTVRGATFGTALVDLCRPAPKRIRRRVPLRTCSRRCAGEARIRLPPRANRVSNQ